MTEEKDPKITKIFWIYLAAVTAIRLFCIGKFELFYDEAFYWLCSCRPDLNYHVNTPLVNYIISIFTSIGGDSEFSVRFGTTILASGTMLLSYSLASALFNSRAALISALTISFLP